MVKLDTYGGKKFAGERIVGTAIEVSWSGGKKESEYGDFLDWLDELQTGAESKGLTYQTDGKRSVISGIDIATFKGYATYGDTVATFGQPVSLDEAKEAMSFVTASSNCCIM